LPVAGSCWSVTLALPKRWEPVAGYADVAHELKARGIGRPAAREIFDAVVAIRRRKLPDPQRSATPQLLQEPDRHARRAPGADRAPPVAGRLPAARRPGQARRAWLIDARPEGRHPRRAGVYEKQALVLVNRGGATGAEILALARECRTRSPRVRLWLEPELVIV